MRLTRLATLATRVLALLGAPFGAAVQIMQTASS
jgi:hypothetical protein